MTVIGKIKNKQDSALCGRAVLQIIREVKNGAAKQRQPETVTIKIYLIEKRYSKADLDVL